MRFPDAIWRPTDKHGYGGSDTHLQQGVVVHSMEGSLQAGFGVLDGPRQASWHFSISKTGQVYQHVDTEQIAWTNGSQEANTKFWGIECEGVAGEALTEPQFQALVRVVRWLWATHEVGAPVRQETLFEHNEMTRFGAPATSCPSGRIPWAALITELEDEMALTPEDKALIVAQTAYLEERQNAWGKISQDEHLALKAQLEALQTTVDALQLSDGPNTRTFSGTFSGKTA